MDGVQDVHLLCDGQETPAHAGIVSGAGDVEHVQELNEDMRHTRYHTGGAQEDAARKFTHHGVRVINRLQRETQKRQQLMIPTKTKINAIK